MIKIVVSGALGRMGKRIVELAQQDPEFNVVGKLEKEANPNLGIGRDLDSVKNKYDCIIEFTTPQATIEHVAIARTHKRGMVIGTTGLSTSQVKTIETTSKNIPVVFSPNMSVGVNLLFNLIKKSAKVLGKDYKVRIKETHHVHKKDKPSGTAKFMQNVVKNELGEIALPVESIREGEVVGDHDIVFESEVDTLKISHSAKTRDIFALGALKAAKFVAAKKNGLFTMSDVLALEE